MNYTPDSWIESEANGGICDDAGYCEECGEHLDSGRCEEHCENETCEHVSHCDCGRGFDYDLKDDPCFVCEAEWVAGHQLTDLSSGNLVRNPSEEEYIQETLHAVSPASPAQSLSLSELRELQDKIGAEAAGLVCILKKLDRYFDRNEDKNKR